MCLCRSVGLYSLSERGFACTSASSAKSLMDDLISFGRSFIHIRKSIGAKTDPWGTPEVAAMWSD